VLVRLLSAQHHDLVPHNSNIPSTDAFWATEILHVASRATTIAGVVEIVAIEFATRPEVLQVVAMPYFASFPTSDFFVLHKVKGRWRIAAGYEASQQVPLSVWIEGKCRKYRTLEHGARVEISEVRGWQMLSESYQADMLGVSVSEALPAQALESETGCDGCLTGTYRKEKRAEAEERESSSQETSSEGDGSKPSAIPSAARFQDGPRKELVSLLLEAL
jgi:hypothetical protein